MGWDWMITKVPYCFCSSQDWIKQITLEPSPLVINVLLRGKEKWWQPMEAVLPWSSKEESVTLIWREQGGYSFSLESLIILLSTELLEDWGYASIFQAHVVAWICYEWMNSLCPIQCWEDGGLLRRTETTLLHLLRVIGLPLLFQTSLLTPRESWGRSDEWVVSGPLQELVEEVAQEKAQDWSMWSCVFCRSNWVCGSLSLQENGDGSGPYHKQMKEFILETDLRGL